MYVPVPGFLILLILSPFLALPPLAGVSVALFSRAPAKHYFIASMAMSLFLVLVVVVAISQRPGSMVQYLLIAAICNALSSGPVALILKVRNNRNDSIGER